MAKEVFKCAHSDVLKVSNLLLMQNPKNNNKHPKDQIERLAKIIDFQGQRSPIVISKRSGFIVKGHGRLFALDKLGWENAAVDYQEYKTEAEEYADMTADNEIARWAEFDETKFLDDIKDIDLGDFDLLGLKDFKLDISEPLVPLTDEDAVPENVETRCKLGDVWTLGNHRLMCGDSTSIDEVEKLMNGEKADMVFTDPPYGVQFTNGHKGIYRNGSNDTSSHKEQIVNDDNTDVISDFVPLLGVFCDGPAYVFVGAGREYDLLNAINSAKHEIISTLIWKKQNRTVALNANYKPCFEMFYYIRVSDDRRWSGNTAEWTVWEIDGEQKNEFHPTQKPVDLISKALLNHTAKVILDFFGGSGSTLIACEKTNRKCYMMELDPKYCDVILKRWEDYTGKKAELNGQT